MLSEKPWRVESTLALGLRVFLCLLAGVLLGHLLGPAAEKKWGLNTVAVTLSFDGAALVWIFFFLREHGVGWAEAFGFRNAWPRALALGAAVAVVVVPAAWILQASSVNLLELLHVHVEEQVPVQLLRDAHSTGKLLYLGFATILLAPVAEEMLFRGILYPLLKRSGRPQLALWGTAILFAAIHVNLAAFVPLVFLAVMFTLVYEWTENLLACIVVHSLFNAANFAMLFVLKNSGQLPAH